MPKTKAPRDGISRSEWEIMKALWDGGPMALGDIHERLSEKREWSYSTVKTLARRLLDKGWASSQRVGNSFLYRAAASRSRAVRREIQGFSERVLDGVLSPFVAFHAERGELTPKDVEALEEMLTEYRAKEGGKP